MAGLLFIAAPEATQKNINEALLSLRDWDHSRRDLEVFKLVTDKSGKQNDKDGTPIPLDRLPENAWTGADLEDIEAYCLHLKQVDNDEQTGVNLFFVIDSAGTQEQDLHPG